MMDLSMKSTSVEGVKAASLEGMKKLVVTD
jgi:hypothetical protein